MYLYLYEGPDPIDAVDACEEQDMMTMMMNINDFRKRSTYVYVCMYVYIGVEYVIISNYYYPAKPAASTGRWPVAPQWHLYK